MQEDRRSFWVRLLNERRSALNRFFLRRVSHPWDAEDLTQEVYLRLLRTDWSQRDEIHDPEAYLYTVAANLVKERAVMQKRAPLSIEDCAELPELHSDDRIEDEAARQQRQQRIIEVFEQLPPRCRTILTLQYREGMTYRQIADTLGLTTHSVKKYVVKGLALCRRRLSEFQ